jgi:hypothetical protein
MPNEQSYQLEYFRSIARHYLEIFTAEGELLFWFVGNQALKMNLLLATFPFISKRDWFITNRLEQYKNTNF